VGFETPEAAALADDESSGTPPVVLAVARGADVAAVLLGSPDWAFPDLQWCHRRRGGWEAGGSVSGQSAWTNTDGAGVVGAAMSWEKVGQDVLEVEVTFRGESKVVPVTNGYYVWMVEGVAQDEWRDPAEFHLRLAP
jgi:hypothetical protein